MTLTIPPSDAGDFAGLPDEIKSEVRKWLRAFHTLVNSTGKIGEEIACVATRLNVSAKTVRRLWDVYRSGGRKSKNGIYFEAGDWRVFVNGAKCPVAVEELPAAFVEFWKALCERNQRKCKPAHRELVRRWDRGEKIPGYESEPMGQPPADDETGIPAGWSYRNLIRLAPSKFELAAARIGRSAAAAHRPLVFTTRVGLSVGQYYLFDDLWHDFKVNVLGQRQAQRLLQFHALDLFSGCNFARGMKPVLENEMTGVMERLKENEMLFLVACVLARDGYRRDGTVLVVEHSTAAIREEFERRIFDLTGGMVRVQRSGFEGASAFAGQYGGRGKGNFRFKAALESLGNLIHNETANTLAFPGQTGSNSRLNAPEELHGRDKHNNALLNAIVALGPDRGKLLKLPFLPYREATDLVNAVHENINLRGLLPGTDHELEGWEEAGLVRQEFRLATSSREWLALDSVLDLPDDARRAIAAVIDRPNLTRLRKLSPAEVWSRGRSELVRLPAFNVPQLLGPALARERTVRSHMFDFESRDLGGSFRYLAKATNRFGGEEMLKDGETYLTHINPLNADELHVSDARGRYLGTCQRWGGITRSDTDALHRRCGEVAKVERELLAPIARRGAGITRERIHELQHNAAVLDGRAVTPDEKARKAELARSAAEITDAERGAVFSPEHDEPEQEQNFSEEVSRYFRTETDDESDDKGEDESISISGLTAGGE